MPQLQLHIAIPRAIAFEIRLVGLFGCLVSNLWGLECGVFAVFGVISKDRGSVMISLTGDEKY